MSVPESAGEHLDVVVVGAGLSGIGAAYRLQTECPGRSFAILEARDVMGGTWDLFRYPGVRSDSDMFTLGYQFRPWQAAKSIADGPTILGYIHDTADEFGIEQHIRYRTRVVGADWSSDTRPLDASARDRRKARARRRATSCTPAPATTTTTTPTPLTSPASSRSPARSCTRSSGPSTWSTPDGGWWSSAAARPR